MTSRDADIIIVGAGLAGGLLAWVLKSRQPQRRVLVLEQASEIPKSKTWSFHRSDLSARDFETISPLITNEWPGYDVAFPSFRRTLSTSYCSIRPETFERKLRQLLLNDLSFNTEIVSLTTAQVVLKSGSTLNAETVIDARGHNPSSMSDSGFQKFVGLNVEFEQPHGLVRPILMDATVAQNGGFRFIYVLPWSATEALIEDTYYGDATNLDFTKCRDEICEYADARGWKIKSVKSAETGKLPIPLWRPGRIPSGVTQIGVSAAFFHAVTGYSLPIAVQVASQIAELENPTCRAINEAVEKVYADQTASWSFFCLLNRMVFLAAAPQKRFRIFERFYNFDQPLIERFYASRMRWTDKLQILSGRPPVPLLPAMKSAFARPTQGASL